VPFTDLGSKWIFGGAHWGHTSLECGSKCPQTSASFAAGQATRRAQPAGQRTTRTLSGLQASSSVLHFATCANGRKRWVDQGEHSHYYSGFLTTSRRSTAQRLAQFFLILHAGVVGRPVGLAPARPRASSGAALDGTATMLSGSAPGLAFGSPWGGRGDAPPVHSTPAGRQFWWLGAPGGLPTRRGRGCRDRQDLLGDQTKLRPRRYERR
jgi:hypothetical protein